MSSSTWNTLRFPVTEEKGRGVIFQPRNNVLSRKSNHSASSKATTAIIYDERDLAKDLNALSFEERRRIDEEIHGVADAIQETPDFISSKLSAMRDAIHKLTPAKRKAYDQAIFLRPSYGTDDSFHLMFLRAKRFEATDAASLMVAYFRSKLDLFGQDLLTRKITWQDLTEKEHSLIQSGAYLHLKDREQTGRLIAYASINIWDLSDPLAMIRACWYNNAAIEEDSLQQQKGAVIMMDFRGKIRHTLLEIVRFFQSIQQHMETLLFRVDSVHILYDNLALDNYFFKSFLGVLRQDFRIRHRFHFGSNIEIQYSLRTFGINLEGCMELGRPMTSQRINDNLLERQATEDAWRKREEEYTKSSSKIALYPNKNDIIVGRHQLTPSWHGNMVYNKLIESQAPRYIAANSMNRVEKILIAFQTIHVLRQEYDARFLTRRENDWEAMEEVDVQPRVSQALRLAARMLSTKHQTSS